MTMPSSFRAVTENEEDKPNFPSSFKPLSSGTTEIKTKQGKVGKTKSALYGAAEGALGIPALVQYGVNEWSKALESKNEDEKEVTFDEENPLLNVINEFPESETEAGRRIRTGVAGTIAGAIGGVPGIIAGIVGSQAGQTVREIWGKEGKFDEFGAGEIGAISADIVAGLGAGLITTLAKSAGRTTANQIPSIFREGETALERASIKNTVQGERNALQNIIAGFGENQIHEFEQQATNIAPQRFTELQNASLANLQRDADAMYRMNNLSIISPLEVTPEQGGRAIQAAANETFKHEVIAAEGTAYNHAREGAKDLKGTAPGTIKEAKNLLEKLNSVTPTGEQNPVIGFLEGLISDLETSIAAREVPASNILSANGQPIIAAEIIPASTKATEKKANDLVQIVQNANQAVNYGSELRQQSHRLKPVINKLREEVGEILNKNPKAANAYQEANNLHAKNAETWGTRYMRSVRFTENPESIVGKTSQASNMRNLKTAIPDLAIQNIAERVVVNKITEGGSTASNLKTVSNIAPELSENARNIANELINVKDPLTTAGGRTQVRNEILKDAARSVNTGRRPDATLKIMETPKGYMIVKEALSGSSQGQEVFRSFERLFMEDIINSSTDSAGRLDFTKSRNLFKNREIRQVADIIGGEGFTRRFSQLEEFSKNLERNLSLFQSPASQSIIKTAWKNAKFAGIMGTILHSLSVPWAVIGALGLTKAVVGAAGMAKNKIMNVILSNPKAMGILNQVSKASTAEEFAKQAPRLIAEIEKNNLQNK